MFSIYDLFYGSRTFYSVVITGYFHALCLVHFLIARLHFLKVKTLKVKNKIHREELASYVYGQYNTNPRTEIWLELAGLSFCEYIFRITLPCFCMNGFICKGGM